MVQYNSINLADQKIILMTNKNKSMDKIKKKDEINKKKNSDWISYLIWI